MVPPPRRNTHGHLPWPTSLIYSLALQHSPKRSSQPILQESCKFTCGTHQLSANIPMSFRICEYSLSRGVAPKPPLGDIWARGSSAYCSSSVQMDMFLFPPSVTDSAWLLKKIYQTQKKYLDLCKSEVNEMKQASEGNFGFNVIFLLKYFSNKANICLPLCT